MSQPIHIELKKKQPFESLEQAAVINLMRTNDQLMNRIGRLFREFGITASQYNVLRILRGEGRPLPCLEIADRMIQVVPAMTGLLDRLEKQALIVRKRCTEDRRVIFVDLTENALLLLARLDQPVLDMHKELVGHLTPDELTELSRLLEKARARASDDTGV
jgi:MarR family transcriptional regulator, 2-MHQ and catechol-resistance regulon repressor